MRNRGDLPRRPISPVGPQAGPRVMLPKVARLGQVLRGQVLRRQAQREQALREQALAQREFCSASTEPRWRAAGPPPGLGQASVRCHPSAPAQIAVWTARVLPAERRFAPIAARLPPGPGRSPGWGPVVLGRGMPGQAAPWLLKPKPVQPAGRSARTPDLPARRGLRSRLQMVAAAARLGFWAGLAARTCRYPAKRRAALLRMPDRTGPARCPVGLRARLRNRSFRPLLRRHATGFPPYWSHR